MVFPGDHACDHADAKGSGIGRDTIAPVDL